MKKLNQSLGGVEKLTKEQMKKIKGGDGNCGACIDAVGRWSGGCNAQLIALYCSSGSGICWDGDCGSIGT